MTIQREAEYAVEPGPLVVQDIKVLHGASYFSWDPVVVLRLDLGRYNEVFSAEISGFPEKLKSTLPSLVDHHCSPGVRGGFFQRVDGGTLLGHVVEHVAIELQQLAGMPVNFGKTRETRTPGVFNVLFQFVDDVAGVMAGKAAVNLINALLESRPFAIDALVARLVEIRERRVLGPSTQAIVNAARARGIPSIRLDALNLVQLGTGRYQKRIRATLTQKTGAIALETALDKALSMEMLREAAVPVPATLTTDSLDEVLAFAKTVTGSITVKPRHGTLGQGVRTGLRLPSEIEVAFAYARQFDKEVLAQETIEGANYRLLTVNHKLIAAARLEAPAIIGNGIATIGELVARLNADPRRSVGDKGVMTIVEFDPMTIRLMGDKGYVRETVLKEGELFTLKTSGNMKLGGSAIDVSDGVHAANRVLAERISRIVGLDVAGIDVMTRDIGRPLSAGGGAVIEVGAAPDFRPHLHPVSGTARPVADALVDWLFPAGSESRIPIVAIAGSRQRTLAADLISGILRDSGRAVGVASSRGLSVDGQLLRPGDASQPEDAAVILKDPTVDSAVLEVSVEGILRGGLGYGLADVGVVLNVADDDLHHESVRLDSTKDLAYATVVVAEQVWPDGFAVLNGDQRMIEEVHRRLQCKVIWFTRDFTNRLVQEHLRDGGCAVVLDLGFTCILTGRSEQVQVFECSAVPWLAPGENGPHLDALLAAVGALHALGIPVELIRRGILAFNPKLVHCPSS